jgi:quercetin dioxygenase-like cupin family protein
VNHSSLEPGTKLEIGDHTVEVVESPSTTGDRYRLRIVADPGGPGIKGDFPHAHPALVETFTCVEGTMAVRLGREVSTLPRGSTVQVPPGAVHGFLNTGDDPLTVDSEVIFPNGYRPEDDLLRFAGIYDRLRREGPLGKNGEPPLLQMAVLTDAYRHVITQPGPIGRLMGPLAALGRRRGYRSEFPEWES